MIIKFQKKVLLRQPYRDGLKFHRLKNNQGKTSAEFYKFLFRLEILTDDIAELSS